MKFEHKLVKYHTVSQAHVFFNSPLGHEGHLSAGLLFAGLEKVLWWSVTPIFRESKCNLRYDFE